MRPRSNRSVCRGAVLARLLFVSLAVLVVGACDVADHDGRAAEPASAAADATVAIAEMSFSPAVINVRAGDSVAWVWDDGRVGHDVVFAGWSASRRQQSGTWELTFERPGTYQYVCSLHPNMTGRVVVS